MSTSSFHFPGVTLVHHPLIQIKLTTLRNAATVARVFLDALLETASLLIFEAPAILRCAQAGPDAAGHLPKGAQLAHPVIVDPILGTGFGKA